MCTRMFGYMKDELGNRALGFLGLQMWILDERRCMQLVLYLLVKNEQLFQSEIMTNKFFAPTLLPNLHARFWALLEELG